MIEDNILEKAIFRPFGSWLAGSEAQAVKIHLAAFPELPLHAFLTTGAIAVGSKIDDNYFYIEVLLSNEPMPPVPIHWNTLAVGLEGGFETSAAVFWLLADLLNAASFRAAFKFNPRGMLQAMESRPRIARMLAGQKRRIVKSELTASLG